MGWFFKEAFIKLKIINKIYSIYYNKMCFLSNLSISKRNKHSLYTTFIYYLMDRLGGLGGIGGIGDIGGIEDIGDIEGRLVINV